jgi:hypothetical protein
MIRVLDLSGEHAITTVDGEKLFVAIQAELKGRGVADLDFSGVRVFASPFFNASIGRLLKDRTFAELRSVIRFDNLPQVGEVVLARVVENSEQYYRNPEARKAVDALLGSDDSDVSENDSSKRH